ncbi:pentapeptide repeat-containing protein [Chondrinema litorale]|uniref:pentapeptide repeat-containing protein n=1 Tax=Chondrinema litorale TaxID=2994555 RepID=UPI002543668A|nr:pentapeptide repeat-containing protein [Chondrinema litorale]UZR98267.1 pentapeptide repeat-containing protein [Chondrinema litorale]
MKANPDHEKFLIECTNEWLDGATKWNEWRDVNKNIIPQLCNIDFTKLEENYKKNHLKEIGYFRLDQFNLINTNFSNSNLKNISFDGADLRSAQFRNANLEGANFRNTKLDGVDFSNANLKHVAFQKSTGVFKYKNADFGGGNGEQIIEVARIDGWDTESWNTFRSRNKDINLQGAYLVPNNKRNCFYRFDFSNINLQDTMLFSTTYNSCNFKNSNLKGANLIKCELQISDFSNSNLMKTNLGMSNLLASNFENADLTNANLQDTNLTYCDFTGARLHKVDFNHAIMIGTILNNAELSHSNIYGVSAWDLSLENTVQSQLNISKKDEIAITVDDIEVAQFIYLLINNQKIRNVINTVTSKTVLILGRFYKERKVVLDALRENLKKYDLAPIIFDFEPSSNRDLTETIQLLANMAKFVIADLTDAKSIPQELSHIIPFFPSVPILPILLEKERSYSMFEHWKRFDSVLPIFNYKDENHLIESISLQIIKPVNDWKEGKNKLTEAELKLEEQKKKFEDLKASDPEQYQKLLDLGIIS